MVRLCLLVCLFMSGATLSSHAQEQPKAKPKPYRLPRIDLKQRIIWDAQCKEPPGMGLAFGGLDQQAREPKGLTRIWRNGGWEFVLEDPVAAARAIIERETEAKELAAEIAALTKRRQQFFHGEELKEDKFSRRFGRTEVGRNWAQAVKDHNKRYFTRVADNFLDPIRMMQLTRGEMGSGLIVAVGRIPLLIKNFQDLAVSWSLYERELRQLQHFALRSEIMSQLPDRPQSPGEQLQWDDAYLRRLVALHDSRALSPVPRALAAVAYDPKSGLYIMFGGDHLDYLLNDTWVFDMGSKRWRQRFPKAAPPPRGGHKLIANGDGTVTLKGGYTYANNTDYTGGQYIDLNDGDWTYDIARDAWIGGKAVPPATRVYRSGPFHPSFFLQGPKPDRQAFAAWLEKLPLNQWTKTDPPQLPQMNRDWGTAVLDADHDVILRFSGGHSAHGGSDVLHFHLSTNRWELPFPVEFPLGQTYSNTEYPEGVNFNGRPWVTGHTYQNYAYDPSRRLMVFTGRKDYSYLYDPVAGDWTAAGRQVKPKGMNYDSCFYTLTLTSVPKPAGVYCWTQEGRLFLSNDASLFRFLEVPVEGEKLPGSVVDNSTLGYDSKRGRLLFFRKGYGDKNPYDGAIYEMDCKTRRVARILPEGREGAAAIPYLCQIRYDEANDLFLAGATLPPDGDGFRRTPAYDCAKNCWISFKIGGDDPSGKNGRNVSLGLMYDAKRKLWWAVDARSQVFVLKLDVDKAEPKPLER